MMSLIRNAFKRRHYPIDIIAQCVRWYLAYALSLCNLEAMMAERGIIIDHSTLHRGVIRLVPLLDKAFRRHKRPVGRRCRMDETYIKIKGQWKYLYRAVDTAGQTIDFQLTARRDAATALRFFRKAIRHHGEPEVVTIDKSGANTAALATLTADKPDEGKRERLQRLRDESDQAMDCRTATHPPRLRMATHHLYHAR